MLHLLTALAPIHREAIVARVIEMLKYQADWTLVATSLVEAGLDFFSQPGSAALFDSEPDSDGRRVIAVRTRQMIAACGISIFPTRQCFPIIRR